MPRQTDQPAAFQGFYRPNYTQVPDELFDELLPVLSGAELKILLYIIRRTFGFKREADAISLSQMLKGITTADGRVLDRGIGLSKPTLLQALRSLEKRNIIETHRQRSLAKGDEPTVYQLKFRAEGREDSDAPVVKKVNQGVVKKSISPVVKKSAPQDTVRQETDISKYRKTMSRGTSVGSHHPQRLARSRSITTGFELIRDTVSRRQRGALPSVEDRQAIRACIEDIRTALTDHASLTASTTRALNLLAHAHIDRHAFIARLYEARSITKDSITSAAMPVKNQMAYFFGVLEDLLGLTEHPRPAARHG